MSFNALKKPDDIELEDLVLSAQDILSGKYPESQVYKLKYLDQELGPFYLNDLQDYFAGNSDISPDYLFSPWDKDSWANIFDSTLFQRRRPELIANDHSKNYESDKIWLLKDGQKMGPLKLAQVKSLVKNKEILIVDMFSIDDGSSWERIYAMKEFDRRTIDEQLPSSPQKNIFTKSEGQAKNKILAAKEDRSESDAMASLAYLGQLKQDKVKERKEAAIEKENVSYYEEYTQEVKKKSSFPFKGMCLFLIFILAIGFTGRHFLRKNKVAKNKISKKININKKKNVVVKTRKTIPKKKISTPAKKVADSFKKNTRKKSIGKKSFTKSNSFKKVQRTMVNTNKRKDVSKNQLEYDNLEDPVENDLVRNKLSKEILDDEDEFLEDEDNASREVASLGEESGEFIDDREFQEDLGEDEFLDADEDF